MYVSQEFVITLRPLWPTRLHKTEKQPDMAAKINYPWATDCLCFKVKGMTCANVADGLL